MAKGNGSLGASEIRARAQANALKAETFHSDFLDADVQVRQLSGMEYLDATRFAVIPGTKKADQSKFLVAAVCLGLRDMEGVRIFTLEDADTLQMDLVNEAMTPLTRVNGWEKAQSAAEQAEKNLLTPNYVLPTD